MKSRRAKCPRRDTVLGENGSASGILPGSTRAALFHYWNSCRKQELHWIFLKVPYLLGPAFFDPYNQAFDEYFYGGATNSTSSRWSRKEKSSKGAGNLIHRRRKDLLVRIAGLEPARVAPLPPQSSVSANSTICAQN